MDVAFNFDINRLASNVGSLDLHLDDIKVVFMLTPNSVNSIIILSF